MKRALLLRPLFLCSSLLAAPFIAIAPASAQNPAPTVLFSSVIPDVRGLAYREVTLVRPIGASEIYIQGVKSLPQPAVHLWIRPAKDGEIPRGIGWNGVEYDLQSVGEPADWRAATQAKTAGHALFLPRAFEFSGAPVAHRYLDQLGAPELRRRARLGRVSYGDADPQVEYHRNLRDAGVSAFVSGDFSVSKRQLQTLLAALPAEIPSNIYNPRPEASAILDDITRREKNEPRPSDEIAGLIWDLQNVSARQFSSPGNLSWTAEKPVQKLIDLGDRAVEPLLETLENDDRLTLSLRLSRGSFRRVGTIGTVREAAHETLNVLLKHRYYATSSRLNPVDSHRQIARQMRADWEKIKTDSPVDRIFKTLSQSGQTPERLEEAARELVRVGSPYNNIFTRMADGTLRANSPTQVPFGESLRERRNPRVSDLLEARILELSGRALTGKPTANALDNTLPSGPNTPDAFAPNRAMNAANALAMHAVQWEPKRGAPLLGAQLERAKAFAAKSPRGLREDAERGVERARRAFLGARLNTPFRAAAMREYSAFLQSQPFGRFREEDYTPLSLFPSDPALQNAAKVLFEAPKRPFQTAAQFPTSDFDYDSAFRLLQSPLVKTPLFKAAIARELGNKTPVATLRRTKNGEAEIKVTAWDWSGQSVKISGPRLENGASQPLRVCDLVGFWLHENRPAADDQPRLYPLLDVSLSTAQRDARLAQIRVLVAQNRVWSEEDRFGNWSF